MASSLGSWVGRAHMNHAHLSYFRLVGPIVCIYKDIKRLKAQDKRHKIKIWCISKAARWLHGIAIAVLDRPGGPAAPRATLSRRRTVGRCQHKYHNFPIYIYMRTCICVYVYALYILRFKLCVAHRVWLRLTIRHSEHKGRQLQLQLSGTPPSPPHSSATHPPSPPLAISTTVVCGISGRPVGLANLQLVKCFTLQVGVQQGTAINSNLAKSRRCPHQLASGPCQDWWGHPCQNNVRTRSHLIC